MQGNSFNLVAVVHGYLTDDVVARMSSIIGESTNDTRDAINAAIPALLTGLDRAASTPDGERRINYAIDDADDTMLHPTTGIFADGFTSDTGIGILHSIFGTAKLSDLNSGLGRVIGFSQKSTSTLLGMLTPLIFGVLKGVKQSAGADRFDIHDLLVSQRPNFAAAVPPPFEETYTRPRVAWSDRDARAYARPVVTHKRSRLPDWLLPLALLVGGLWLLWFLFGRPAETAFRAPSTVRAGSDVSLDHLKTKYNSVFEVARAQGVRISDLRQENGRLAISAIAPSENAATAVWNEVIRVNPALDDVTMDVEIVAPPPGGETKTQ
jgi:hypothetical protein